MGLKTIWITLRAANYTTAAFSAVVRQVGGLEKAEKRLVMQNLALFRASMSAGLMFQTMGSQMGGAAGEALNMAGNMAYVVAGLGAVRTILPFLTRQWLTHTTSIFGASIAYWQLALAAGAAFGAFALVYEALIQLNSPALTAAITVILALTAALWALFVAESAATWGVALALGGAAAGAAFALSKQLGAFQHGTRMIEETGPVIAHKGEIIYNPSTGRPTQVGNDLAGGGGSTTIYEVPIHIDEVNTKADVEEMDETVKKSLRKSARSRR
jgi:hypothetical protein